MPFTGIWKSRFRFLLFVLPRALMGQYTATRMAGYAIAFTAAGSDRIGSRCLHLAVEKSIDDPRAFDSVLDKLLDAGQISLVAEYANAIFDHTGIMPGVAARLTGEFLYAGASAESLRVLDRLIEFFQGDLENAVPAPVSSHKMHIDSVREQLGRRSVDKSQASQGDSGLNRLVARLCFRFSAFDTAAKLFSSEEATTFIDSEDQIAYAYALLRSGKTVASKTVSEQFGLGFKAIDIGFDWRILLATLMFAFGYTAHVKSAVRTSLRSRMSTHPDFEEIVRCCDQIVDLLAKFPDSLTIEPSRSTDHQPEVTVAGRQSAVSGNGRQKIFVCGNGWSGSSALCDALADFEVVAAAPGIPIDQFINKDTSDELMFVQGEGGLGRLWRQARQNQGVRRMDLWELFRCHVVGMGAIGFAEHKSANAAASLLEHHGSRLAREFRNAFYELAHFQDKVSLDEFRGRLVTVTEALTELIFDARDGQCVVFNNAMFGSNLDMVEIFTSFKLVVVVRDPLDQYADRREQDLKHWMSARRFVSFYKSGRTAFHTCKAKLPPELSAQVREIEFERFVLDAGYREDMLDWLLDGLGQERISANFDPAKSSGNIGIHKDFLTQDEVEFLDNELREWRSH